ncbi:MAG: hypothetical protein ACJAZO_002982 [Myxococcota bacterium]|jgi:hypothetical protein
MLTLLVALASAAPISIDHQGRLLDVQGTPVNGTEVVTFALYDSASNPTPEWTEDYTLALTDGYYSVSLGSTSGNPVTDAHLDHDELWLGLSSVSLGTLQRSRIGAVPYARNGGGSHTTVAKVADYTVTLSDAAGGTAFSNDGASGLITFTLPQASEGRKVTVLRAADHPVRIASASGDNIEGSTLVELHTRYGGTTLFAINDTLWVQADGDAVSTDISALQAGVTFTNCAQTGRTGPSAAACSVEYASAPVILGNLAVSAGIQSWTAPITGTYRIEVWGAAGGGRSFGPQLCIGGLGGYASGDIALSAGQTLKILVGQQGGHIDDSTTRAQGDGQGLNGAGGGGSFVTTTSNSPLVIAGGGGGRFPNHITCSDLTIHGGQTNWTTQGGGPQQDGDSGGGGGGLTSNGAGTPGELHNNDPGDAFTAGGEGGVPNLTATKTYYTSAEFSAGGFGGGGGARYWSSSSGGGGYHGGKGWNTIASGSSFSGGTNYVSGANQTSQAGQRPGQGQVRITLQ